MTKTEYALPRYLKAASVLIIVFAQWTILHASEGWSQTIPSIVVREQSLVKGEKVYLKDVAILNGTPAMQKRLGMIHLAFSPSPGNDKTLHGSWIVSKILVIRRVAFSFSPGEWITETTIIFVPFCYSNKAQNLTECYTI